ncbi:MAG TPA: hypothetical protein VF150_12000 [Thermoanaerobaculia bacterium]
MRKILTLVLAAGLFAALPPTHSQNAEPGRDAAGVRRSPEALRLARQPLLGPKDHQCVLHEIACGQTVQSSITAHDCAYENTDMRFDIWVFDGVAGQTVTLDLSSNDFDPFLILYDPDLEIVADDDNGGPGATAARIVHTLDRTSSEWNLDVTPLEDFVTGNYTLSLKCSNQPPPPPPGPKCPNGFFKDPAYPDFCFRVQIIPAGQAPIVGTREPSCVEDTVCVSGALPGRSEAFLRILGPRPNGFLWPTIVRFTPSRVVVEMHQLSSGDTNTYTLDAVPPGVDDLSGLQDRQGFLPE